MKLPAFDLDIDKHNNATLVVACSECGHEQRRHLKSLNPDAVLRCDCGHEIQISASALQEAQRRHQAIKSAFQLAA